MFATIAFSLRRSIRLYNSKASKPELIEWVTQSIVGLVEMGNLDAGEVSGRYLKGHDQNKGLCELLITKKALLQNLMTKISAKFPWPDPKFLGEIQVATQDFPTYLIRSDPANVFWQSKLPPSALKLFELIEDCLRCACLSLCCRSVDRTKANTHERHDVFECGFSKETKAGKF